MNSLLKFLHALTRGKTANRQEQTPKKIDPKPSPEHVACRLVEMGYLKFVSESEVEIARQELIDSLRHGYLGTDWDEQCVCRDRRSYPADSEELAEGQIGETILLMRGVLYQEGVKVRSVKDDFRDDGYDVVIDGRAYPIFEAVATLEYGGWGVATKRFLQIVNGLLRAARSSERLYGMYGGNDVRVVLLTTKMHSLLRASRLIANTKELPYPPSAIDIDGANS